MKVMLLNGSPHKEGSTHFALSVVAEQLGRNKIDTEEYWVGNKPMQPCIACNGCTKAFKCVMADDVNVFIKAMEESDGMIVGSPVYFANATGAVSSFLDRLFYAHSRQLRGKLFSSVAICRRGGSTATLDQLNKYPTFAQMPVISSQYWNIVHGNNPNELKKDLEGLQTLQVLGDNFSWILKCIDAGKKAGITMPPKQKRVWTNFISEQDMSFNGEYINGVGEGL